MKTNFTILTILFLLVIPLVAPISTADESVCAVYFTGVGCPHCANTDPVILESLLKEMPNLVVIEYEIYQLQENAPLIYQYNQNYNSGLGIPLIIFNEDLSIRGDIPVLRSVSQIKNFTSNDCPLIEGTESLENLDFASLHGKPKIWADDRVIIKIDGQNNNQVIRGLLTADSENMSSVVEGLDYKVIVPEKVPLSGKYVNFKNAIQIDGWVFQWNGAPLQTSQCPSCPPPGKWSECINNTKTRTSYECGSPTNFDCVEYTEVSECGIAAATGTADLTLPKIISLAAVDAINPCALAVLALMLIAILTYNPKKRSNVFWAGMAFIAAVFFMYIIYGLVIIRFFQLVQLLTAIRLWIYKILGVAAILLGFLNIKDFIKYKPGGALTEMPLFMRPKMKKIIEGITSPAGAFSTGLFVTVFLLPCTIGPYVIAGGILSALELLATLPWLILYNIIFVVPMAVIVLMVYVGFAKVEDVSGWKEKNIRYLHLFAGAIMFGLGLAMIMGWV